MLRPWRRCCGGCFQPIYGQRSPTGGAARRAHVAQLACGSTKIEAPNGTAEARLAVEVRNELIFGFTGGAGASARRPMS